MAELKYNSIIKGQFDGVVVVLGANGAGKTTFLKHLHGIDSDQATWDDQPAISTKHLRGFVSQSPQLLNGSVEYNLKTATKLLQMDKSQADQQIERVIEQNALGDLRQRFAPSLSGGEQARLCFARACLNDPKVLLLDEITAHLDPKNTKRLENAMKARAIDGTVFFVTHIISQARRLADHIIFMDQGEVLYSGPAEAFWTDNQDEKIRKFLAGELL